MSIRLPCIVCGKNFARPCIADYLLPQLGDLVYLCLSRLDMLSDVSYFFTCGIGTGGKLCADADAMLMQIQQRFGISLTLNSFAHRS